MARSVAKKPGARSRGVRKNWTGQRRRKSGKKLHARTQSNTVNKAKRKEDK